MYLLYVLLWCKLYNLIANYNKKHINYVDDYNSYLVSFIHATFSIIINFIIFYWYEINNNWDSLISVEYK